jgi:F0F1-type ATP synthase membrane subunit a
VMCSWNNEHERMLSKSQTICYFIGTMFLFYFCFEFVRCFLSLKIIELPSRALPTNDINTTIVLPLITLEAYFYAGLSKKKGLSYFKKSIKPIQSFYLSTLEDFTKSLSLGLNFSEIY